LDIPGIKIPACLGTATQIATKYRHEARSSDVRATSVDRKLNLEQSDAVAPELLGSRFGLCGALHQTWSNKSVAHSYERLCSLSPLNIRSRDSIFRMSSL